MRCCTLMVLAICFTAVAGQTNSVKDEMKKLEGKWAQVSVEADGKKLTDKAEAAKVTVTISGVNWLEQASGVGEAEASTFKINPANNPKQIDLTDPKEKKGKTLTWPGIYKLQGDTLTTAIPLPFEGDFSNIDKRPTEFSTKPGDGFVVIIYKRVKS